MAVLSNVPGTVDLACLAGDTFTFTVTAPDSLVAGREWTAQIRGTAGTVDAVFTITPPSVAGGPAYLSLPSAETARLASVQPYRGVWDVQVAGGGGADPVTTLARGRITVEPDVTRAVVPL